MSNSVDIPDCPPEICAAHQPAIRRYCAQHGFPPNEPVPIYVDGDICYCYCTADQADEDLTVIEEIPDCTTAECNQIQAKINNICKAKGWPQGYPVLVIFKERPCYCYCGG